MGNSVPRIPLEEIHLTPGNVLIRVNDDYTREAQSMSKGDGWNDHQNLIRGRVIRVCTDAAAAGAPSPPDYLDRSVAYLKPGDEVWVRARKGFPLDIGYGKPMFVVNRDRMFVVNEWDVAIKLKSPNSSKINNPGNTLSCSPPPYQEKSPPPPPMN